jgi:hypothetical protein
MTPAYAIAKETEEGDWVFLAEPFWGLRWTRLLCGAKLWLYPEGATAAMVAREDTEGAVVVPVVALQPSEE